MNEWRIDGEIGGKEWKIVSVGWCFPPKFANSGTLSWYHCFHHDICTNSEHIGVARVLRLGGQMSMHVNLSHQKLKTHGIWSTIFWDGPQIHIKKKGYTWEGQCQDWKFLMDLQLHWGVRAYQSNSFNNFHNSLFSVIVRPKNVRCSVSACKSSEQIQ